MKTARALTFDQACARYVHRFTMEFCPAWARKPCEGTGKFYAPQFRTDREWYENSAFPGEDGNPFDDGSCYTSGQTWPLGQWLDSCYLIGGGA